MKAKTSIAQCDAAFRACGPRAAAIANMLGVSRTDGYEIRKRLIREGRITEQEWPLAPYRYLRTIEAEWIRAARMRGVPKRVIAETMGRSRRTVAKACRSDVVHSVGGDHAK